MIYAIGLILACHASALAYYVAVLCFRRRVAPPELVVGVNVCVLLPIYNESPEHLLSAFDSLERQTYDIPIHAILIDDGSTNHIGVAIERWTAIPRRHQYRLVTLKANSGSKGAALDHGLQFVPASTDVLAIVDSDTLLHTEAMSRALSALYADPRTAAVCGFVVPDIRDSHNLISRLQFFEHTGLLSSIKLPQSTAGAVSCLTGAFALHRMAAIRSLGGWREWLCEDIAWTWKAIGAGYRIGYVPSAIAYTKCPQTYDKLIDQRRRWARGRIESIKSMWRTSPKGSIRVIPVIISWVAGTIFPRLAILAFAAMTNWWLPIGCMVCASLELTLVIAHRRQLGQEVEWGANTLTGYLYGVVIEAAIWHATILGVCDALFRRRFKWLTR